MSRVQLHFVNEEIAPAGRDGRCGMIEICEDGACEEVTLIALPEPEPVFRHRVNTDGVHLIEIDGGPPIKAHDWHTGVGSAAWSMVRIEQEDAERLITRLCSTDRWFADVYSMDGWVEAAMRAGAARAAGTGPGQTP
jgi:hypothetical protein